MIDSTYKRTYRAALPTSVMAGPCYVTNTSKWPTQSLYHVFVNRLVTMVIEIREMVTWMSMYEGVYACMDLFEITRLFIRTVFKKNI